MTAAELVATGACEMFWFHGLSAGKRFELSKEAEAFVSDNARIHIDTNVARNIRWLRQITQQTPAMKV
jgi:hypothetical protein